MVDVQPGDPAYATLNDLVDSTLETKGELKLSPRHMSKYELYRQQLAEASIEPQTLEHLATRDALIKLYHKRMVYEDWIFGLAMFGWLFMMIENEVLWLQNPGDHTKPYRQSVATTALKFVVLASTVVLEVLLVLRYYVELKLRKVNCTVPWSASLHSQPALLCPLLAEMLVCGFLIPPFVDFSLSLDRFVQYRSAGTPATYTMAGDMLGVFMTARFYLLARLLRNHSGLYGFRIAFLGAINCVDSMSPWFHFKCLFNHKPHLSMPPLYLTVMFVTAACVRVVERAENHSLDSYSNAIWLVIITMSTVGYGDLYPHTTLGRLFIVLGGVVGGTLLVGMLVAGFASSLEMCDGEATVLHVLERDQWVKDNRFWCATLIQRTFILSLARREHERSPSRSHSRAKHRAENALFVAANKVRALRRSQPPPVHEGGDPITAAAITQRSCITRNAERIDQLDASADRLLALVSTIASTHGTAPLPPAPTQPSPSTVGATPAAMEASAAVSSGRGGESVDDNGSNSNSIGRAERLRTLSMDSSSSSSEDIPVVSN